MINKNTPATKRVALALQAAGLNPDEARAAVEELKAQVYKDLYDELTAIAQRNNPYLLKRTRLKWSFGINKALELVHRRRLQAETAFRVFRDPRDLEVL